MVHRLTAFPLVDDLRRRKMIAVHTTVLQKVVGVKMIEKPQLRSGCRVD